MLAILPEVGLLLISSWIQFSFFGVGYQKFELRQTFEWFINSPHIHQL
jgi:hypothetical protein